MTDLTARLRAIAQAATTKEDDGSWQSGDLSKFGAHCPPATVLAMLDAMEAAEALAWTAPKYRTLAQSEDVVDALARFREVAG